MRSNVPHIYIFIMCAEILTIMFKNILIKGITIENIEHNISQFADGTILILDESITGLKINYNRIQAVWKGS